MVDYPNNLLLGIMPFMYGSPYYGYGNMYNSYVLPGGIGMCANVAIYQQQMQAVNVAQLQSRIAELQMQQCCCTNHLNLQIDASNIARHVYPEVKKRITVYELDKIVFPEDPIRDYIEAEIARIKEKYAKRIRQLDALVV